MKKSLTIVISGALASIILIVVLAIALGIGATKPIVNVTEEFLEHIKSSQYKKAYDLTNKDYQSQHDLMAFQHYVVTSGLNHYQTSSWNHRSIENQKGQLEGSVTTTEAKIPTKISLVYEGEQWKIKSLELKITPPSEQLSKSTVLPHHDVLRALAKQSLLDFNQAVLEQDFKQFHDKSVAQAFQKEFSPQKLKEIFKPFIEKKVDLSSIQDLVAIFDETPLIVEDILTLKGYYLTTLHPLRFKLKYIQETEQWKLTSLSIDTESLLKDSVEGLQKLPSTEEQELMVKSTLLDFNDSVLLKDFSQFHEKAISTPWRKQWTPQKFKETFSVFIENEIDFSMIEEMTAILDQETRVSDEGFLVLKGHFETKPNHLIFSLEYLWEEDDWKISGINIKLKKP